MPEGVAEGLRVPDFVTVPVNVGDTVPDIEAPWLEVWEEVLLLEVDVLRVRVTDNDFEGVPVVVLEPLCVGERLGVPGGDCD